MVQLWYYIPWDSLSCNSFQRFQEFSKAKMSSLWHLRQGKPLLYGVSIAVIVFWVINLLGVEVDEEEQDVRQRAWHCNGCNVMSWHFFLRQKMSVTNEDTFLGNNLSSSSPGWEDEFPFGWMEYLILKFPRRSVRQARRGRLSRLESIEERSEDSKSSAPKSDGRQGESFVPLFAKAFGSQILFHSVFRSVLGFDYFFWHCAKK